jgi:Domain of unknown function (DUF1707)/Domain of unknown function (DUF4190)
MGERSKLRASDADRDHVAERLQEALTEGRLTHEEFEERLRVALSARTYGQLDPLLADLPAANPPATLGYLPEPKTNGLAIASLALGVAGFLFLWGIGPLLAVVCGVLGKREIRRSNGTQTGSGLATAGMILGIIGLVLAAAFVLALGATHMVFGGPH